MQNLFGVQFMYTIYQVNSFQTFASLATTYISLPYLHPIYMVCSIFYNVGPNGMRLVLSTLNNYYIFISFPWSSTSTFHTDPFPSNWMIIDQCLPPEPCIFLQKLPLINRYLEVVIYWFDKVTNQFVKYSHFPIILKLLKVSSTSLKNTLSKI